MAFGKKMERTFFKTLILSRFICLTKLLHRKRCTQILISNDGTHSFNIELYEYWVRKSNQTSVGNGLIIIIRLGYALVNCRDFHSLLINVRLEYLSLYIYLACGRNIYESTTRNWIGLNCIPKHLHIYVQYL